MTNRELGNKIIIKLREDIELWKPLEKSDFDNDFKAGIRQGLTIAISEVKRSIFDEQ